MPDSNSTLFQPVVTSDEAAAMAASLGLSYSPYRLQTDPPSTNERWSLSDYVFGSLLTLATLAAASGLFIASGVLLAGTF
jgi:hypothetical protein